MGPFLRLLRLSARLRPNRRSAPVLHEVLESRRLLSGNLYQFHSNDLQSTGVNPNEKVLTPGNVNVSQFGKHWSTPATARSTAQPLYV